MSSAYECPDCGARVVLTDSGGVYRTLLCEDCEEPMEVVGSVPVEWSQERDNWRIA